MDVDWKAYQIEQYSSDARRVLQRLAAPEPDEALLLRALALLRTYLEIPRLEGMTYAGDEVMVQLANTLYQQIQIRGHWETILQLWTKLWAIAANLADPVANCNVVEAVAIIKKNQGNTEEALQLYEQMVATAEFRLLAPDIQGRFLHQMGVCCTDQGDYTRARIILNRCLEFENSPKLFRQKGFAWNILGNLALFQGDFAEAQRCYEESLAALKAGEEAAYMVCVAYQSLGRLFIILGEPAKAIPLLEQGLAIRRHQKEIAGAAQAATYLALAYIQAGEYLAEAERLLNQALPVCKTLDSHEGTALCYLCFGHWEQKQGDPAAAIAQWQQALDLLKATPLPGLEFWVLVPLFSSLLRQGHYRAFGKICLRLLQNIRRQRLHIFAIWRLARHAYQLKPKQRDNLLPFSFDSQRKAKEI